MSVWCEIVSSQSLLIGMIKKMTQQCTALLSNIQPATQTKIKLYLFIITSFVFSKSSLFILLSYPYSITDIYPSSLCLYPFNTYV